MHDFYVSPEYRSGGTGNALLTRLAEIAKARNCARIEFEVIDTNDLANRFYKTLGAQALTEWTPWRFAVNDIESLRKPLAGQIKFAGQIHENYTNH